jgi:hypothetical protein
MCASGVSFVFWAANVKPASSKPGSIRIKVIVVVGWAAGYGAVTLGQAFGNRNPARRSASAAGTPSIAVRWNWGCIRSRIPCTAPSCADDPSRSPAWPLPEVFPVPRIPESVVPVPIGERGCACASRSHYNRLPPGKSQTGDEFPNRRSGRQTITCGFNSREYR